MPHTLATPTLHLVIDDDARPARYGVMASILAAERAACLDAATEIGIDARNKAPLRDIGFGHLSYTFDTAHYADAVQHVALTGDLLPSGLVWYERLNGRPAPQPRALTQWLDAWFDNDAAPSEETRIDRVNCVGRDNCVDEGVIPIHPSLTDAADDLHGLVTAAQAAMRRIEGTLRCYRVVARRLGEAPGWALVEIDLADPTLTTTVAASAWVAQQDRYGRWQCVYPGEASTQARSVDSRPALTVALIGTEVEQFDGYPGTLAALGDAADAIGVTLDMHFVSPHDASALLAELQHFTHDSAPGAPVALPRDPSGSTTTGTHRPPLHGIVLPGGADMGRVAGQIAAAAQGWRHRIPTLGLCLGMQTMTTAALQRATGRSDITLLELAPDTTLPSFVRNADGGHRLGLQPVLAASHGPIGSAIRCNHRFRLNPALFAALAQADIDIAAWDASRTIVDGIAAAPRARHPFYAGAQGHPELMSTPARPHPLILSWLRAVCAAARPA
ncbi:hypothetical protein [Robbsia sp. KACC 23696]|uniref:glutamine amidotransferase-related protein n=1 Tax=Robbsia sp. KACC 23696 TaxID=3149231 RepID=UPI00325AC638